MLSHSLKLITNKVFAVALGSYLLFGNGIFAAQTVTLGNGTTLELKGIGKAAEFRTDIYIGTIYAPRGVDSFSIIKETNTPKRIAVRYIVGDSYSYRKVGRHFKERIALNNAREIWQPMTREIVTFSRLFTENFIAGDEIRLDYVPGTGTKVFLNGVLFETFKNPEFFNLFINAWVGSVPPSKSFKQGIMGELPQSDSNALIAEFSGLNTIKGRFVLSTEAVEPKEEPKAQVVEKPKPKPQPKPKQEVAKKPEPKPQPKPKPKQEVVKKPEPEPPEEDFIDEDLIRGSYVRDLISAVRKNQEYPRDALINGDQGDAVAMVSISRDGEVSDVELIERTGSRILDRAILKMIKKTAPFPEVPKELSDTTFTFEIPVSYQL
ncbi:MAG: TonB family protein [Gammaproteobacteria bacterium]|nr:TonB family protein [Gammaproteobacteria bacterium]